MIKLDLAKLLGFRIAGLENIAVKGPKAGTKIGPRQGLKVGVKVGSKVAT